MDGNAHDRTERLGEPRRRHHGDGSQLGDRKGSGEVGFRVVDPQVRTSRGHLSDGVGVHGLEGPRGHGDGQAFDEEAIGRPTAQMVDRHAGELRQSFVMLAVQQVTERKRSIVRFGRNLGKLGLVQFDQALSPEVRRLELEVSDGRV